MKDAVILIPSYEPDELLVNVVNELYEEDFPILVVNDGSGKEFDHIFEQIKDKIEYLSFDKNKGKGAALKYGYSNLHRIYPEAKYVITADGDGQHALKDIIRVYEKLCETNQLVFGVRQIKKDVPFKSKLGNNLSKINRSLLTKQYIQDDQCGLRGFPIRYIPDLLGIVGNRYEYEMNQIVKFQLMQLPIYTLPIETIYLDGNSRSHFSPIKDTARIQGIILAHSIPALIMNAVLIAAMIVLFHFTDLPIIAVTYSCYTACFLAYFLWVSIIYPTKSLGRRILKELFFVAVRMCTCHLMLFLTMGLLNVTYFAMVPTMVIFSATFNALLSWALRKIFPSF